MKNNYATGEKMIIEEAIDEIVNNVKDVAAEIDSKRINDMLDMLVSANNVFIIGLGRSGLVARAFATYAPWNKCLCSWGNNYSVYKL